VFVFEGKKRNIGVKMEGLLSVIKARIIKVTLIR
jgi:hypothetical protein